MASNFYEAGLEFLFNENTGVFNNAEKAVIRWLLETAKFSEANYWEAVTSIPPLSPFGIMISSIKRKCREQKWHSKFEEMQRAAYMSEPVVDMPA